MPGPNEIKAGEAYVQLSTRDAALVKGLEKASKKLNAFGSDMKTLGLGISAVGAAVLAPLGAAATYFSSYGDQVAKMAKRTGLSVQTLTELKFVASQSGTEFEALEASFRKMQRSIYDAGRGISTQVDTFKDLNLSYDQLKNLSPEDQFKTIGDALGKVTDDTKQAALAQSLFGRSGTQLIPLFEEGAAGIDKLRARARELGLVMSNEDVKSAEAFNDALDEMFTAGKMVLFQVGGALAPTLSAAAKTIAEIAARAGEWVKQNRELIVTIAKAAAVVLALGATLTAIGYTSIAIGAAFGGVVKAIYAVTVASKALGAVWAFLAANPIVLVLAGIAAAVAIVAYEMNRARREAAALSQATADLTARNDAQRSSDLQKLERLKMLSRSNKLNADQIREAVGLTADLEDRYGKLGVTTDSVTGTINGMADAWSRVADEMKRAAMADIDKQISALEAQAKELDDMLNSSYRYKRVWENLRFGNVGDFEKHFGEQSKKVWTQIAELYARQRAVAGGDVSATTGGAPGGSAPTGNAIIDNESTAARRVAQLKLQLIDDEHKRAIAVINERYDYDIAQAKNSGATQATLDDMEKARKLEIQAENREAEKKSFTERLNDTMRILEANEQQAKEVADLQIELDHKRIEDGIKGRTKGAEQEKALAEEGRRYQRELLNIEEERAVAAAKAAGQDLHLVKKEYELRRQLVGDAQQTRVESVAQAQGTFNSAAIRGMFGGNTADRTAKAAEATAQNTKELGRLFRMMLEQGQSFA